MTRRTASLLLLLCGLAPAPAAEPFRFPEGRHGKGELRYVNGLPVLTVAGTPEEIGEQVGRLAARPAARMLDYPRDLVRRYGGSLAWPWLVRSGLKLYDNFPDDSRRELEALVKASGLDRQGVIAGNTVFDVKKLFACSALLVGPGRSDTGGPLFGRNLDYPSLGYAQEYTLVTVYRPRGKHAFASVGFPGLVGCLSGINDAGLALGILEVYATRDPAERYNAAGIPYAVCYRTLLEECTTVEEAAKRLESLPRTTTTNLAVCDRNGGAVLEVTPRRVVVRRGEGGLCACTNHFCTAALRPERQRNTFKTLDRFASLERARDREKLTVADVQGYLHAAHQGDHTLQTMVFEPATRTVYLACGKTPASGQELRRLPLEGLFKKD